MGADTAENEPSRMFANFGKCWKICQDHKQKFAQKVLMTLDERYHEALYYPYAVQRHHCETRRSWGVVSHVRLLDCSEIIAKGQDMEEIQDARYVIRQLFVASVKRR